MAKRGPIERHLEHKGVSHLKLTREETEAEQKKWRVAFSQNVKRRSGAWVHRGFDWHAFSYRFVYTQSGDEAQRSYRACSASEFLVLPHIDTERGFRCSGSALPDFAGKPIDAYIAPTDYKWTMVFTHEAELGPYFTTADWAISRKPV